MWSVAPCLSQILGGRRRVRLLLCLFVCWLVCFFSRCPHFRRGKWERGERRRRRGRAGEGVARARCRNGAEGREIERPTSPLALSSLPVLRRQKNPKPPSLPVSLCPSLPPSFSSLKPIFPGAAATKEKEEDGHSLVMPRRREKGETEGGREGYCGRGDWERG